MQGMNSERFDQHAAEEEEEKEEGDVLITIIGNTVRGWG